MATYVNIKQWKIDFISIMNALTKAEGALIKIALDDFNGKATSREKRKAAEEALPIAIQNAYSLQSTLISALTMDGIDPPKIDNIISSFLKVIIPIIKNVKLKYSAGRIKSKPSYDIWMPWLKKYIDSLIPPGA